MSDVWSSMFDLATPLQLLQYSGRTSPEKSGQAVRLSIPSPILLYSRRTSVRLSIPSPTLHHSNIPLLPSKLHPYRVVNPEAEQSGGVAHAYGYFEVAGGIEKGEDFAGR